MILHIAKKEFTEMLRESRFQIVAFIIAILMIVSILISKNYYEKIRSEHELAMQTSRQQWENQGEKNPHSAAHYGTYAFKPIQSLSLIDNGLDKYLGVSIFLEGHRQNDAQYKLIADQNSFARFGEMTPSFIMTYLLPLLIILISFSSLSGEKEKGTLKLLLSQGVSKTSVILGKIVGVWLSVGLLLLPLFLVGLGVIFTTNYQAEDLSRYALIFLTYLLYFGVFINISVLFSSFAKSSTIALVGLIGCWIVSCLLVPKLTSNLSKYLHPTPSAMEYQASLKESLEKGLDGHNPYNEFAKAFQDSVLKANQVDSIQKLPFNYSGLIMQAGEEHERFVYDKHVQQLNNIYLAQLQTHQASAIFSPTVLTKILTMQFARTDMQTHFHFAKKAEDYRIALVRQLNGNLQNNSKYGDWDYAAKPDFFKNTVKFEYVPPSLGETMQTAMSSLLCLTLWFALSLGVAIGITTKLKV